MVGLFQQINAAAGGLRIAAKDYHTAVLQQPGLEIQILRVTLRPADRPHHFKHIAALLGNMLRLLDGIGQLTHGIRGGVVPKKSSGLETALCCWRLSGRWHW